MKCAICKSDLGMNPGGCLCRECSEDGLRPGEPVEKDWRRCRINEKWTGILHVPSWTIFEIDGLALTSRIVLLSNSRVKPTPEELMNLRESALLCFLNGNVSRHSPSFLADEVLEVARVQATKCKHLRGLHL
jgi:hypothetical protein